MRFERASETLTEESRHAEQPADAQSNSFQITWHEDQSRAGKSIQYFDFFLTVGFNHSMAAEKKGANKGVSWFVSLCCKQGQKFPKFHRKQEF